ncbi:MAG: Xaa-Pro peptidase family protein [bacterium]
MRTSPASTSLVPSPLPLVPPAELAARAERFAARLRQDKLDGAFLLHPSSLFWISGTLGEGWPFVTAEGRAVLPIRMSVERAAAESPLPCCPARRPADLPGALAALGVTVSGAVGLELDVVPVATFERLRRAFPSVDFRDVSRAIREVRAVKSAYEIEWIEKAGRIVGEAMDVLLPRRLAAGVSEIELSAFVEGEMRRLRHQGVVRVRRWNLEMHLGTVSAGASASYPCYFDGPDGLEGLYPAVQQGGGERVLEKGATILVDYVGGAGGYLADRARVYCVGEPSKEARDAHELCREILSDIKALLRPGAIPAAIWAAATAKAARSPWADRFMGFGENRVQFVGHGVGLDLDELPVLASGFETPLEAGNVLAVEPKIFFGDPGAVGVENTYVVTEQGGRDLTAGPEEIRIAG